MLALQQRRTLHEPGGRLRGKDFDDRLAPRTPAQLAQRFQYRVVAFLRTESLDALPQRNAQARRRGPCLALELIDQGRLADPRLARDRDELALTEAGLSRVFGQRGQGRTSSDQAMREPPVGRSCE